MFVSFSGRKPCILLADGVKPLLLEHDSTSANIYFNFHTVYDYADFRLLHLYSNPNKFPEQKTHLIYALNIK